MPPPIDTADLLGPIASSALRALNTEDAHVFAVVVVALRFIPGKRSDNTLNDVERGSAVATLTNPMLGEPPVDLIYGLAAHTCAVAGAKEGAREWKQVPDA